MRVFTIHTRPAPPGSPEEPDIAVVREGFCWMAALFSVAWALWHRLWLVAAALFALNAFLGAAHRQWGLGVAPGLLIALAYGAVVGYLGNDWLRAGLTRRGYREESVVAAEDAAGAELRYRDRMQAPQAAVPHGLRFFERRRIELQRASGGAGRTRRGPLAS